MRYYNSVAECVLLNLSDTACCSALHDCDIRTDSVDTIMDKMDDFLSAIPEEMDIPDTVGGLATVEWAVEYAVKHADTLCRLWSKFNASDHFDFAAYDEVAETIAGIVAVNIPID